MDIVRMSSHIRDDAPVPAGRFSVDGLKFEAAVLIAHHVLQGAGRAL